jgi:hypothetical protein
MDDIDRLLESPDSPAERASGENDFDWMTSFSVRYEDWENEFMTFGESVTLLIAIGVLL